MPTISPRETLETMLGHLGFSFQIEETQRDQQITLNIVTRDASRLIGRDGHTLEDLQYLLNRMLQEKEETAPRVIVDVENYRKKEQGEFLNHIMELAEKVKQTGKEEILEPMNSYDRRQVHQAFAENPDISTRSEEVDARFKRIILEPRKPRS